MQQLQESQNDFDITTKNLEAEQAIFQKQIKERFEADRLQTKNTQYSKNVEIGKEFHQKQVNLEAARTALELTIRQKQYTAAQTQEHARAEQEGGRNPEGLRLTSFTSKRKRSQTEGRCISGKYPKTPPSSHDPD